MLLNVAAFADRIIILCYEDDYMKRLTALILVFAALFALASCSKIDSEPEETTAEATTIVTTTLPAPVVNEKKHHKDFKDKNGRTVYTVDVVLPEISENGEQIILDYVNELTSEVFDKACKLAESNIENASKLMDKTGKPWSTKITFESTYLSGRFVCFIIKNAFSMTGDDADPSYSTMCFDVEKGMPCTPMYFATAEDIEQEATDYIITLIQERAPDDFYPDGGIFGPAQVELLKTEFSLDNFYITENGIGFYYSRYTFDSSMTGTYKIELSWEELDPFFYSVHSIY